LGVLRIEQVSKSFGKVLALDGVSFDAAAPGVVGIIGPNGAGKSTLIDIISGFEKPDTGKCSWKGKDLTGKRPAIVVKAGIARTFQSLRLAYNLSALDNVLAAAESPRSAKEGLPAQYSPPTAARELAYESLRRVGLSNIAETPAAELSFGMQKALSLACVLALNTDVILLDEPFGGLHTVRVEALASLLRELSGDGKLIVFIEHDLNAVRVAAERVLLLAKGRVIAEGTTDEILSMPDLTESYLG
jgi:branched-chain amino acid transport system ATP-binding protein